MPKYLVNDTSLSSIADAIRTKGGTSNELEFPTEFISAIEDLPTGGGTYQAKTGITPTTSSQTILPDNGYDALSSVQINAMPVGVAGTPTATKGTVSNNSVSVTPSVTNTTGYITGSTETGTPVTVSASELVSGSETKTENGTYDVTNLAELVVNVASSGGVLNVVTGTFKGTTTGAAMDVDLNYTGSGYPVAFLVYVSGGPRNMTAASGTNAYNWFHLVQRFVCAFIVGIKNETGTTPTYKTSGTENSMLVYQYRKNSASAYDNFNGTSSNGGNVCSGTDAIPNNSTGIFHFKASNKISVYIADTSYGFAANIEYTYHVIYSS